MRFERILTAKKCYKGIFLPDEQCYVVSNSKEELTVYNYTNTVSCEEEFDVAPFLEFYGKYKERKIAIQKEKEREFLIKEEIRIKEIESRILECDTPGELAEEFNFKIIETAGHWNELYTGESKYAVLLDSKEQVEIMEIANRLLDISGEYGEACNRAGEHHHKFKDFCSLEYYQKCIRNYFDEKFFYRDAETEIESVCYNIKEAAGENNIKEIQKIMDDYNDLIPGYYCNESLVVAADYVNSDEFTGYEYDVYTYNFAFRFEFKTKFN